MKVVASPEAVELVRERGGALYVWTFKGGWACSGVVLRADTKPHGRREFRRVPADEFDLYLSLGLQRHEPETLEVEARRFPRKHLSAYWNGCPWVM